MIILPNCSSNCLGNYLFWDFSGDRYHTALVYYFYTASFGITNFLEKKSEIKKSPYKYL
ncbi:hypothetical protein SL057_001400 [Flavobacterium psychrophilum]|nr:hypothetical protein [Flavobacterium psychrophilum]